MFYPPRALVRIRIELEQLYHPLTTTQLQARIVVKQRREEFHSVKIRIKYVL